MNLVVLEIRSAGRSELGPEKALAIGRLLAAEAEILAAWITEDGSPALRGIARLQFAVHGVDGASAARVIWPAIERVQKEHRLDFEVVLFTRKRLDTVPHAVADLLRIDIMPNHSTLAVMLKRPRL